MPLPPLTWWYCSGFIPNNHRCACNICIYIHTHSVYYNIILRGKKIPSPRASPSPPPPLGFLCTCLKIILLSQTTRSRGGRCIIRRSEYVYIFNLYLCLRIYIHINVYQTPVTGGPAQIVIAIIRTYVYTS